MIIKGLEVGALIIIGTKYKEVNLVRVVSTSYYKDFAPGDIHDDGRRIMIYVEFHDNNEMRHEIMICRYGYKPIYYNPEIHK